MIIDKRNERLYWKKYFDDERRLRVEQKQKRQKQNTFIRKSDNHQESMLKSLQNEINAYKKMLSQEQENRDSIIAELHYEKERSNKQYLKLEKIKHIMEL